MKLTHILESLSIKDHIITYRSPMSGHSGNLDDYVSNPHLIKTMIELGLKTHPKYFSYEEALDIANNEQAIQSNIPVYSSCTIANTVTGQSFQPIIDALKNQKGENEDMTITFKDTYTQYLSDSVRSLTRGIADHKLQDRPAILIIPVPSGKQMSLTMANMIAEFASTKNKNVKVFNHFQKNPFPSFNTIARGKGTSDDYFSGEVIDKREQVYNELIFRPLRTSRIDLSVAEAVLKGRATKVERHIQLLQTGKQINGITKRKMIEILTSELEYLKSDQLETDLLVATDKNTKGRANKNYNQNSAWYSEVKTLRDDLFSTMDEFNNDIIEKYVAQTNPKKFPKKPLIIIVDDMLVTKKSTVQIYKHMTLDRNLTADKYDTIIVTWAKERQVAQS